jgi:hypothetical protein
MSENGSQVVFKQLFDQHRVVQIPMIQRDYAQGRASELEVRDQFLNALQEHLELAADHEKLPLNLDFVYGNVEGEAGKTRFSPLDGQQRLTTLFLIHWYLAWKDKKWDVFNSIFLGDNVSRFAYRVRPSSTDFFDFLVTFQPEVEPSNVECLSDFIKDHPEYFRSWRLDPTIQSTLVMLDAIHDRFSASNELFDRLVDEGQPAITFQLLDLDKFGLSDDLYIKMNARGVPLTPFETFKARYEQELETQFEGKTRAIGDEHFEIADFVSRRLDTAWMNLLWPKFKGRKDRAAAVDEGLFNLFRGIALVTRFPRKPNCLQDLMRLNNQHPNFSEFHKHDWLDEDFTDVLIPVLESWSAGKGFTTLLPTNDYFDEERVFSKLITDSTSLEVPEVVLFMAYVLFVKEHEGNIDADAFQNWMRVIHNLVVNSNVDRDERLPGGMTAVLTLLPNSHRILDHLATLESTDGLASFPKRQVNEESLKSALLLNHDDWQALIDRAELHGYFRGQIEFLLDFCGAVSKSQENVVEDWDDETHEECQSRFEDYLVKAEAMFTRSGLDNTHFLWQRALLSIGDYLFPMTSQRKSLLLDAATEPNSWKRLLRGYQSHEASGRQFLKKLWDHLEADAPFPEQLESLVSEAKLEPWREAFVKSPSAFSYCGKRTIRWNSDQQIYLLSKVQMNSAHAELFSYKFFRDELLLKNVKNEFTPLQLVGEYYSSNETGIEPGFRFTWSQGKHPLTIDVEWKGSGYELYIACESVDKTPAVKSVLLDNAGFKVNPWNTRIARQTSALGFHDCLLELRTALSSVKAD